MTLRRSGRRGDDHRARGRHVVVLGGGASGVMVAARLLDRTAGQLQVTLVDARGSVGAGVAYSTTDPEHLLNVPAAAMSADPARPDDFARWIESEGLGDPTTFVARREYRRYLVSHLEQTVARWRCATPELLEGAATAIRRSRDELIVTVEGGKVVRADAVVLATGNPPPRTPAELSQLDGRVGWVADPWAPGALEPPGPLRSVVLVGTGLTMVDVAITLCGRLSPEAARPWPPMIAYSRTGLLPERHVSGRPHPDTTSRLADLGAVARAVRELESSRVDGQQPTTNDWRVAIDGMRPQVNGLWRTASVDDQAGFRANALRSWEVLRHRMSPATAGRYDQLERSGALRVGAGQLISVEPGVSGRARLRLELDGAPHDVDADLVVNCTGPGRTWDPSSGSLVANLVGSGMARPDPHGLGLDCDAQGRLRDADGRQQADLYVIGPPRRGSDLETTAVPELRIQADEIARAIAHTDPVLRRGPVPEPAAQQSTQG